MADVPNVNKNFGGKIFGAIASRMMGRLTKSLRKM
jgi:hypothetical protein